MNLRPNVWIHGASGRMGQAIQGLLSTSRDPFTIIGGSGRTFAGTALHQGELVTIDKLRRALKGCDLTFDFSTPSGNELLLECFRDPLLKGKAVLIGTTNLSQELTESWHEAARMNELRLLLAPNTSIGILLLMRAASMMLNGTKNRSFDIELVESHHRGKADAPSGTAKMIAQKLCTDSGNTLSSVDGHSELRKENSIGVHAIRGGKVFGEHEVRFLGDLEELSISHRALDRKLFAEGAIRLGQWLLKRSPGIFQVVDVDPSEL